MDPITEILLNYGVLGASLLISIRLCWYYIKRTEALTDAFTKVLNENAKNESAQSDILKDMKDMLIKLLERSPKGP